MDSNPILKYEIILATLFSKLSGRDMEAMKRLDSRIRRKYFRARIPSTIMTGGESKNKVRKPLYSALGMRTTCFRKENELILWKDREGSDSIPGYMRARICQANIDANSTQGMRLPTLLEQEESRSSSKEQFLAWASARALLDDKKKRGAKEEERIQKLRGAAPMIMNRRSK